jgi:hypothetical protein
MESGINFSFYLESRIEKALTLQVLLPSASQSARLQAITERKSQTEIPKIGAKKESHGGLKSKTEEGTQQVKSNPNNFRRY